MVFLLLEAFFCAYIFFKMSASELVPAGTPYFKAFEQFTTWKLLVKKKQKKKKKNFLP